MCIRDRIQKHLDALETSFTIGVDNDSYPPSIKNIVNGITAYAMNQETWKVPNHTVQLTATRKDDSNFAFAVKYNDIPVDSITISGDGVKDGKITRDASVRVLRDNIVIHEGELASLRRFKDDVKEVASGYECGMQVEKFNDIKIGDVIECFVMEQINR